MKITTLDETFRDMAGRSPWHEDEEFWEAFRAFIFPPEKIDEAPEQVEQLLALLDLDSDTHVLDVACGVGRHAIPLAKRGFTVTGVDATDTYLETAERRAREESVKIEFLHEDMRTFERTAAFDAIFNLYTSFGYFEQRADDERVARNFYRSLKPDGVLVVSLVGKEELARDFENRSWEERDGTYFLEERRVTDDWSRLENRWILISDGAVEEYDVSHRVYSAVELYDLLRRTGFDEVEIYGDFDGSSYDENAEKLVAVARK